MLDAADAVRAIEACTANVCCLKNSSYPEKTEFMIIGTKQQLKNINIDCKHIYQAIFCSQKRRVLVRLCCSDMLQHINMQDL
jgi:hypothetical protein